MKHFAIIGKPVSHSVSGEWFNSFFAKAGIDADFVMIEPDLAQRRDFRAWIGRSEFSGLLVTIPYKMEVMAFLNEADEHARAIGAANIISITGGVLKGFNTDHSGFESELIRLRPHGVKKALVLGIGGAASAVLYALKRNGIESVMVSRNKEKGDFSYDDLPDQILTEADLIVNCSPLGMGDFADSFPPINYSVLNKNALAFDLIYNPAETVFLKKCAEAGCQTENGRGMVEFVYKRALELWGM